MFGKCMRGVAACMYFWYPEMKKTRDADKKLYIDGQLFREYTST
jgi:hypothetical protein